MTALLFIGGVVYTLAIFGLAMWALYGRAKAAMVSVFADALQEVVDVLDAGIRSGIYQKDGKMKEAIKLLEDITK